MKRILNGITKENPIFVLTLGLCSALAITNKFENAYIMGICVLIVLTLSSIVINLTKKLIPENVKIPVYVLIIATFVTIIEIIMSKHLPKLYEILGIYLPLIVVNCIILGRNIQVSSKEKFKTTIEDSIGIGIGYTISLMIIALIREVLGNNTITLMDNISTLTGYRAIYKVFPRNEIIPMNIFREPTGAFLTIGLLIALFKKIGGKNESN